MKEKSDCSASRIHGGLCGAQGDNSSLMWLVVFVLSIPLFTLRQIRRERERHNMAVIQPANPAPVRQLLVFTVTKGEPAVHLAASQIPLF